MNLHSLTRRFFSRSLRSRHSKPIRNNPLGRPLEALEDRSVPATFAAAGANLNLALAANEAVGVVSNGTDYVLTLAAAGNWSGTNSANVTGNGTTTLTVTAAGLAAFDTVNIDDSGANTSVTFNHSGANSYSDTFNVILDDAAAAAISFDGSTAFSGSAALSASTTRNIVVNGPLSSADGNLILSANQQVIPSGGDFIGANISANVITTGGSIEIDGRGGNSPVSQYGVFVVASVSAGGAGTVRVAGTGGAAFAIFNHGVYVLGVGATISSAGGSVDVTGQGGGTAGSGLSSGVFLENFGTIAAGGMGTVTVNGTGGPGTGGNNRGVLNVRSVITSAGGNVDITGTAGGGATSSGVSLNSSGTIFAGANGTLTITADTLFAAPGTQIGGVSNGTQTIDISGAGTVNGVIAGAGANFVKQGTGTLNLTGTNTYTGTTTVSAGTLFVNGSISSNTTVTSPGVLGGDGTITGNVGGTGTVAAGNSPGILNIIGDFTPLGNLNFEVNPPANTAGTDFDQINVTGAVDLSGATLTFSGAAGMVANNKVVTILTNDDVDLTTVGGVSPANGATVAIGTNTYRIFYNYLLTNDVVLIESSAPTTVYVDDSFTPVDGSPIVDADLGTTGNQAALYGFNAFNTVGAALAAVTASGTAIVNSGIYAEAVSVLGTRILRITGPDVAGTVTFNSLAAVAGTTVQIVGTSALTVSDATSTTVAGAVSGTGSLTKAGAGTLTLSGTGILYTGATTVQNGILELRNNGNLVGEGFRSTITLSNNAIVRLTATVGLTSDLRGGGISGTGSVVKGDTGFVRIGTFAGLPALTYSGNTTVESGTLELQGQAAGRGFDTAGNLIVNTGASFVLSGLAAQTSGNAARFGGLSGLGAIIGANATPFLEFGANTATFDGTIADVVGITLTLLKTGVGTQTFTGANTYTGTTTVSSGTLLANNASGSATGTGTVNVGSTLGGTGSVSGIVNVGDTGSVAPGDSTIADTVDDLGTGNLSLIGGSTLAIEINSSAVAGIGYDQVDVAGTVSLGGSTLSLAGLYVPDASTRSRLIIISNDSTDAVAGIFIGLPEGSPVSFGGGTLYITYAGGDGNDVVLVTQPEVNGRSGADTLVLRQVLATPSLVEFSLNGAPFISVSSAVPFLFDGRGGSDLLLVDTANGDPISTGNAAFLGEILRIQGTGVESVTIVPTATPGNGILTITSLGSVSYTGASDLDAINLLAATLQTGNVNDTLTIQDASTATNGGAVPAGYSLAALPVLQVLETAVANVPRVGFRQIGTVTVDAVTGGNGNDAVTIASGTGLHLLGNFAINTGTGTDTVTVTGNLTVAGDIGISTQNIAIDSGTLTAGTTGATNTITLNAGTGAIATANASLDVFARNLSANAITGIDLDTRVDFITALTAGVGSILLDEVDSVELTSVSSANGLITVTANGAVAALSVVSTTDLDANDIGLSTSVGSITITTVNAGTTAGDVNLTATAGSLLDDNSDATLTTGEILTLRALSTIGAPLTAPGIEDLDTNAVSVDAATTAVGANNGIWITDAGTVTFTQAVTADGVVVLDAATGMTLNVITAGGTRNVRLRTTTSGDITLGTVAADQVNAAGDSVLIQAFGAVVDGNGANNNVTALNLATTSSTGIGTLLNSIDTTVTNLAATGAVGGVFVRNAGTTTVAAVTTFGVTTTGVTSTGTADINLTSTDKLTVNVGVNAVDGDIDLIVLANGIDISSATSKVSTGAGTVLLNPTSGGVTQTGASLGVIGANIDLRGAGTYALDNANNNAVNQFRATVNGAVTFRDANDLTLDPAVGVTTGGNNAVTLFSGTSFTAIAISTGAVLVNAGTAIVRIVPGSTSPGAALTFTYNAEVIGGTVFFGNDDPSVSAANLSADKFIVLPSRMSDVTVVGNDPTTAPGDSIAPIFSDPHITNVNFVVESSIGASINGRYEISYDNGPLKILKFRSIESLGNLGYRAIIVQTNPQVYSVRLQLSQLSPIGSSVKGQALQSSPFVVSPNLVNPSDGYSAPSLAFGDVNGDGVVDLVIANGSNDAPQVTVINGSSLFASASGDAIDLGNLKPSQVLKTFYAFLDGNGKPTFRGGLSVAVKSNGDNKPADIVLGPGPGGGPVVEVWNTSNGFARPASSFFAFEESFRGGVTVATGDYDKDGKQDIIVGTGPGGAPRVQMFGDGNPNSVLDNFFAYDSNFRGGVRVAAGNFDGVGGDDIATAPGYGGGPHVQVFGLKAGVRTVLASFYAWNPNLANGLQTIGTNASNGVGSISFGAPLLQSPGVADPLGRRELLVSSARGTALQMRRFNFDINSRVPRQQTANPAAPYANPISLYSELTAPLTINGVQVDFSIRDSVTNQLISEAQLYEGGGVSGFSSIG